MSLCMAYFWHLALKSVEEVVLRLENLFQENPIHGSALISFHH